MTEIEQVKSFIEASRILTALRNAKLRKAVTGEYLEAALDKLHAAYGSELVAGLNPDAAKIGQSQEMRQERGDD